MVCHRLAASRMVRGMSCSAAIVQLCICCSFEASQGFCCVRVARVACGCAASARFFVTCVRMLHANAAFALCRYARGLERWGVEGMSEAPEKHPYVPLGDFIIRVSTHTDRVYC